MKRYLLLTMLFLIGWQMHAQEVSKLIEDSSLNVIEVEKKVEQLPSLTKRDKKTYARFMNWAMPRADGNGSLESANKSLINYRNSNSNLDELETGEWSQVEIANNELTSFRGRAMAVWANPFNDQEVLAGGDTGGLFKSTNGGLSWTCLTEEIPLCGVQDLFVNPINHENIYILTSIKLNGSLKLDGIYGAAVYVTNNGGLNWDLIDLNLDNEFYGRELEYFSNAEVDGLVVGGSNQILFVPFNGDEVQQLYQGGEGYDIHDVTVLRDKIFVSGNKGLLRITKIFNNGNWGAQIEDITAGLREAIQLNENITIENFQNLEVDSHFGIEVNTLWVAHKKGIYRSTNNGSSFVHFFHSTAASPFTFTGYVSLFEASPDNHTLFIGGIRLFKVEQDPNVSTFSGKKTRYNCSHADVRDVAILRNDEIYAVHDGGIDFSSNHHMDKLSALEGDLSLGQAYSIDITDELQPQVLGGYHDNGTNLKKQGAWTHVFGCDGGNVEFNPKDSDKFLFVCNLQLRSENFSIDNLSRLGVWYDAPFTFHSELNNNWIYSSYLGSGGDIENRLMQSRNSGVNFTRVSGTDENALEHNERITNIEVAVNTWFRPVYYSTYRPNPNFINRLYKRTCHNLSQYCTIDLSEYLPSEVSTMITDIETHANELAISYGGFSKENKVFHSHNGGLEWENITYNLPNFPILDLLYDPFRNQLYASSDLGVYVLQDDSEEWKRLGDHPYFIATEMRLNSENDRLYVSTYGRGMWQVDLESEKGEDKRPSFGGSYNIQMSPNPSSDYIVVDLNSVRTESIPEVINIMSSNGRNMFTQQLEFENGSDIKVHIANWPNGHYVVQVIDAKGKSIASSFHKM